MVEPKRKINKTITLHKYFDILINILLAIRGAFKKDKDIFEQHHIEYIRNHFYQTNKLFGEKYLNGNFPFKNTD